MTISLDETDRKILDQLRIDGRMPFTEIAKQANVSEASVRSRYRRMRDRGIVQIIAMPDPILLGSLESHLALHVRGTSLHEVAISLMRIPEVRYVASGLGSYDLIVNLQAQGKGSMAEMVLDKIRRIKGVETVDALTVHEIVKDSYLWEGFSELPS